MNKQKLLKFAKLLHAFAELHTKEGVLISDSEIVVGSEVFVANENGDMVTPVDGEYNTEGECYVVVGGIVTEIKALDIVTPTEVEPVMLEDVEVVKAENETLKAENEALKAENETMKTELEEMKLKVEELEEKLKEPVEEPITMPVVTEKLSALSVAFKR